jgi:hypothetical protein
MHAARRGLYARHLQSRFRPTLLGGCRCVPSSGHSIEPARPRLSATAHHFDPRRHGRLREATARSLSHQSERTQRLMRKLRFLDWGAGTHQLLAKLSPIQGRTFLRFREYQVTTQPRPLAFVCGRSRQRRCRDTTWQLLSSSRPVSGAALGLLLIIELADRHRRCCASSPLALFAPQGGCKGTTTEPRHRVWGMQ